MRLIQITDLHLHADPKARSRTAVPLDHLEAVLSAVQAQSPDAVVVTGDVTQDDSQQACELAAVRLHRLGCPWAWIPGNHDQPGLLHACHPLVESLDLGTWQALLLDTQRAGQPQGRVGEAQLARLSARLEADPRPALIAMHHPPVALGTAWMDAIGLEDSEAFWRAVRGHRQLELVLFGHAHQDFMGSHHQDGHRVMSACCPAVSDQFLPGADKFSVDAKALPGFRIIDLTPAGAGWTSRVERVALP